MAEATTGTFEMAEALTKHKMLVAIHKHYAVEQWRAWIETEAGKAALPYVSVSSGSSEADIIRLAEVLALSDQLQFICLQLQVVLF